MEKAKTNINEFIKKHEFFLVCFLCLIISISAIWLKIYALIGYALVCCASALIFDLNKNIV